jgi:hypothetical protein
MWFVLGAVAGVAATMLGFWLGRRQPLEWKVATLRLYAGDIVAFRSDRGLPDDIVDGLKATLQQTLPFGVRALVLTPPVQDIAVIREGEGLSWRAT